ncbi:hypothetical protein [Chamaesiphon sp.]|uniref:hypothetical protein n=1 Tax=Chamaesiphon sp. TaxID=2814140 RepID=UPI00359332E6
MFNNSSSIYVRTNYQCLTAFVDNILYRVKIDPKLKQTYYAIHLGETLIYFKDLISNRVHAQDPIGMAIYNARMRSIEAMVADNRCREKCQVLVEHLHVLANRDELLDGRDLSTEPLYVSGKHLVEILTNAGYPDAEADYGFVVIPDRLYLISDIYIEDGIADLSPDNVADILSENSTESSYIFAGTIQRDY